MVNWIALTPEQVQADIDLFRGRTGQYVFISSASAYQTPPAALPITESTPLRNPEWLYSRNKIACEDLLTRAYREDGFPATIVRPSHTYDHTLLPISGGWTTVARMRQGKKVFVHGDGTSLWVMTHNSDFAKGFVGLLGNPTPSVTFSTSPPTNCSRGIRSTNWWPRPPVSKRRSSTCRRT
ncbi:MAG: NAD-dependent epimerase/dehydratase family protein [Caldilineaceae bacterium]